MFSPGACPELHNGGSRSGRSGRLKIYVITWHTTVQVSQTYKLKKPNFYTNDGISLQGAKGSRRQDLAEAVSFGVYLDSVYRWKNI